MGIDDVTMGDAQLVQAGGPEFEFRTVCASETDVVQPWASLIETVSRIRCDEHSNSPSPNRGSVLARR